MAQQPSGWAIPPEDGETRKQLPTVKTLPGEGAEEGGTGGEERGGEEEGGKGRERSRWNLGGGGRTSCRGSSFYVFFLRTIAVFSERWSEISVLGSSLFFFFYNPLL